MTIDAPYSSDGGVAPRRDLPGLLVPPAMLVAAAAMAVASHLHLGVTAEVALAIGVALFCLMLMCHVLLRAAEEADRAEDEAAQRRIAQVASPMPVPPPELSNPAPAARERQPATATASAAGTGEEAAEVAPEAAASPGQHPFTPYAPQALPDPPSQQQDGAGWMFRPVDLRLPTIEAVQTDAPSPRDLASLGALRPTIAEHGAPQATGGVRPVNREAERIDAILKRLATQIHSGRAAEDAAPAAVQAPPDPPHAAEVPSAERTALAAAMSALVAAPAGPQPAAAPGSVDAGPAEGSADAALDTAVDALRATVAAMRGSQEADAVRPALPAEGVPSPAELRIAAVAEALAAERADVFLSPILGLASEHARHFEVSVHLRSAGGDLLDAGVVAAGAGLLPLLDALRVRHAAGFALMLERRGRDGTVFSRVEGSSLVDEQFVADVAGRHAQGIADRMVLSFAQDEVRGLGPGQLDALGDLGRLGFRFALLGITHLDMDFEALAALGFEFVKLDAGVFQGGLVCAGAEIPASDICRHFEDLGLSVIVSGIADPSTRDRLMGCGVVFGQGPLFGEPRPVPVAGAARTMAA